LHAPLSKKTFSAGGGGFLIVTIFAAGTINNFQTIRIKSQPGEMIIAADGGARHCNALGIVPDLIIGDLDSLGQDELNFFKNLGVQFLSFPARKDDTDLELAIQYACQHHPNSITIYGALGMRWDQTLANLMLLASPELDCVQVRIIDDNQEIFLVRPNEQVKIFGTLGDTVSLIPIGGNAHGITTLGLEYSLSNETLYFGKARGVSNVLRENPASVSLRAGSLICVVIHHEV
jgi:thiamine pyrophosphokinase